MPPTVIYKDRNVSLLTSQQGDAVFRTENPSEDELWELLCSPDDGIPAAVCKLNDTQARSTRIEVLFNAALKTLLANPRGGHYVVQKFLVAKGNRASVARCFWQRDTPAVAFVISNSTSFADSAPTPELQYCTAVQREDLTSIVRTSGAAVTELSKMTDGIVRFIHEYVRPPVRFEELAADYIHCTVDGEERWMFLQVRGFRLTTRTMAVLWDPTKRSHDKIPAELQALVQGKGWPKPLTQAIRVGGAERAAAAEAAHSPKKKHSPVRHVAVSPERVTSEKAKPRLSPCGCCGNRFYSQELSFEMSLRMMLDTVHHCRQRDIFLPWFSNIANRTIVDSDFATMYRSYRVCQSCFQLYKIEKQLIEAEIAFANALGIRDSNLGHTDARTIVSCVKGVSAPAVKREMPKGFRNTLPIGEPLMLDAGPFAELTKPNEAHLKRFILLIADIRDLPDMISAFGHVSYTFSYSFLGRDVTIPLELDTAAQIAMGRRGFRLPIAHFRVFYFFGDQGAWGKYLQSVRRFEIKLAKSGGEVIASAQIPLQQLVSGVIDRVELAPILSSARMERCTLRCVLGVERLSASFDTTNIQLRRFHSIWLPKSGFCTGHPLSRDWLSLIPDPPESTQAAPVVGERRFYLSDQLQDGLDADELRGEADWASKWGGIQAASSSGVPPFWRAVLHIGQVRFLTTQLSDGAWQVSWNWWNIPGQTASRVPEDVHESPALVERFPFDHRHEIILQGHQVQLQEWLSENPIVQCKLTCANRPSKGGVATLHVGSLLEQGPPFAVEAPCTLAEHDDSVALLDRTTAVTTIHVGVRLESLDHQEETKAAVLIGKGPDGSVVLAQPIV